MRQKTFTNSVVDCVYNRKTNNYLDTDLELIKADISDLDNKVNNFKFFNLFKQIGIVDCEETIEQIANNLPEYSMFYFHKTSGHVNDMYPHSSGLLVVQKGYSSSRVKFEFSRSETTWIGFYDALNSTKWSGWRKISTDVNTINIHTLKDLNLDNNCTIEDIIKAMPNRSEFRLAITSSLEYRNLLNQCPKQSGMLIIYKERSSRTNVEFIASENGYTDPVINPRYWVNYDSTTDRLSKWECIYVGSGESSKRPVRSNAFVGMQYFDTTLNKPIWWNGNNWVDALGSIV